MSIKAALAASVGLLTLGPGSAWASAVDVLHKFSQADGQYPSGGLIEDAKGNLFGTAAFGGANYFGDVFELHRDASGHYKFRVIYNFQGSYDGVYPSAPLVMDARGHLFGTAIFGGEYSRGSVFELAADQGGTWSIVNTYDFQGNDDGGGPSTAVTLDGQGHIFGTTSLYGKYGYGTIFEITRRGNGWIEKPIHQFKGKKDGGVPASPVSFGPDGMLYGTAQEGGHDGLGIVFRLQRDGAGWKQEVIKTFRNAENIYDPSGQLIFDGSGDIFGVANQPTGGEVYELSPPAGGVTTWFLRILHRFRKPSDGLGPAGGVVFDTAGTLYGATTGGGDFGACQGGCGTIYRLDQNENGAYQETVLARLHGHDGEAPVGQLLVGLDDVLYGATSGGSASEATVFSLPR